MDGAYTEKEEENFIEHLLEVHLIHLAINHEKNLISILQIPSLKENLRYILRHILNTS